jgi:hypothetical protein
VLRFLAGAIGEADDRESRDTVLKVGFDLNGSRVEPDQRMSDGSCEHVVIRDNVGARKRAESVSDV